MQMKSLYLYNLNAQFSWQAFDYYAIWIRVMFAEYYLLCALVNFNTFLYILHLHLT